MSESTRLAPQMRVRRTSSGDGSTSPANDQSSARNHLLRGIPREEYAWLGPILESVVLRRGEVLAEPEEPFRHVYFPDTCVASQINRLEDGGAVEVGTIGREGMVGLSVFLDAEAVPSQVLIQIPGVARRVRATTFAEGIAGRPALQRLLRRYTHAFLTQVAQTAACNRAHPLEERCARWLLMTHDRVGEDNFQLTHEFLSIMLGVRRAGVTVAAGGLQRSGLIQYRRGVITVLDREGLEAAACECYAIVRSHFARVLGLTVA